MKEIWIWLTETIIGKLIDILPKFQHKHKLIFTNSSLSYLYSFYDEKGNHVLANGSSEIYEIHVSLGILNSDKNFKNIRNVHVIGKINGEVYRFLLFDTSQKSWQSYYNIQAGHYTVISWIGIPEGHGRLSGYPGIIPITLDNDEINFQVSYTYNKNSIKSIPIKSITRRRLNPDLIVA